MNLATILNQINHSVFIKDKNGTYIWVNEQFAQFAGLEAEKIIGLTDQDLVWSEQAAYFKTANESVLQGNQFTNIERTITSSKGVTKIIISLTPYRDESSEIVGVLGNFFDCSHQFFVIQTNGTFQNNKYFLQSTQQWLTTEELRVLYYHFHNFAVNKIAEKTNKSEHTVSFHLENIKQKMGVQKKNEITKVAIKTGVFWDITTAPHRFAEQEI